MTSSESQLRALPAIQRAIIKYISIDPRTIVLTPNIEEKTATGAIRYVPQTPRAEQDFAISPLLSAVANGLEKDSAQKWYFNMVGAYDAIVELNDTWEDGNTKYRVISIKPKNDYEVRAIVEGIGKDPNYG